MPSETLTEKEIVWDIKYILHSQICRRRHPHSGAFTSNSSISHQNTQVEEEPMLRSVSSLFRVLYLLNRKKKISGILRTKSLILSPGLKSTSAKTQV